MFENIEALTLISSESCNLNCSYCNIAHNLNTEKHKFYAAEVKKALKNGEYLKNILQVCKKYNINQEKITKFSLWGQEPTLTMNELCEVFPNFYKEFPNITDYMFSTNAVAYYDRIIKYIKLVDSITTKPANFDIQLSFDGIDITEQSRGINPIIILNNLKNLFLELNKIELKNTSVHCQFHSVFTNNLMKKLYENDEYFFNYFNNYNTIIQSYLNMIENKNVHLDPFFSPGIINPHNGTVEDGQIFTKFYEKCLKYQPKPQESWEILVSMFYDFTSIHDTEIKDIEEMINKIVNYEYLSKPETGSFISHISHPLSCGWGDGNLEVRYDGTLIHCHNVLFGLKEDELDANKGLKHQTQAILLNRGYYPNLQDKEADKNFEKFYQRSYLNVNSSFLFSFSQIVNLMILLAKSNQISEYYKKDIKKLLRHAYIMTTILPCWDNNLTETGSGYGRTAGHIRFFCNGFIDYIDKFWKEEGKV